MTRPLSGNEPLTFRTGTENLTTTLSRWLLHELSTWKYVIVVEHDLWDKRLNNSVVVVMYIFKWRVSCVTLTYESLSRNELPWAVVIITHSMCAAWFRYNTCLYKMLYETTVCKIYNKAPVLRIAGYLHLRCGNCIQLTFERLYILINHCRYIGCSIVLCVPE